MITIVEFNKVLASTLTPITLISGVGVLTICMTNRYNHATNRIRQLMAKRETPAAQFEPDIDHEIDLIFMRASLLRRSLLCVCLSTVFTALLVAVSVGSRFLEIDLKVFEGFALVAAIALIVFSVLLFSAELNLSLKALGLVIDHLPKHERSADSPDSPVPQEVLAAKAQARANAMKDLLKKP